MSYFQETATSCLQVYTECNDLDSEHRQVIHICCIASNGQETAAYENNSVHVKQTLMKYVMVLTQYVCKNNKFLSLAKRVGLLPYADSAECASNIEGKKVRRIKPSIEVMSSLLSTDERNLDFYYDYKEKIPTENQTFR